MAGVALVGWSGSLVKDAIKAAVVPYFTSFIKTDLSTFDEPEASQVLVGRFYLLTLSPLSPESGTCL